MKRNRLQIVCLLISVLGFTACNEKDTFEDTTTGIKQESNNEKVNDSSQAKTYRVMPIGDSLTEAADPGYRGYLYQNLIANGYNVDFVGLRDNEPSNGGDPHHSGFAGFNIGPDNNSNPGVYQQWGGTECANIYYQLDGGHRILSVDCDIILLMIGTNDFWNVDHEAAGYNPEHDGAIRLEALVEKIYTIRPDVTLLVTNITPTRWDIDIHWFAWLYNSQVPGIVERQKEQGRSCYFVDVRNYPDWQEGDYTDDVHLNASGNEKLAAAFYSVLAPVLTERIENE